MCPVVHMWFLIRGVRLCFTVFFFSFEREAHSNHLGQFGLSTVTGRVSRPHQPYSAAYSFIAKEQKSDGEVLR